MSGDVVRPHFSSFRRRFAAGEQDSSAPSSETPTSHAIEIIGDLGFDFVVIDEEHAPFERSSIEGMLLLAAKSGGEQAGIVRVAAPTASRISFPCSMRRGGVLVPHVATARRLADCGRRAIPRRPARLLRLAPRRRLWRRPDAGPRRRTGRRSPPSQ